MGMEKNPFPTAEKGKRGEVPAPVTPPVVQPEVDEQAVDHGVEESFPASDPVLVSITKVMVPSDGR